LNLTHHKRDEAMFMLIYNCEKNCSDLDLPVSSPSSYYLATGVRDPQKRLWYIFEALTLHPISHPQALTANIPFMTSQLPSKSITAMSIEDQPHTL
jgi:hypothetical protein